MCQWLHCTVCCCDIGRVERVDVHVFRNYWEHTVCAYAALEIRNLSERWVLSACAQKIAECAAVNAAVSALVEELECFAVVCGGLVVVIHCCSSLFRCAWYRAGDAEAMVK